MLMEMWRQQKKAWAPLAKNMGVSVEEAAKQALIVCKEKWKSSGKLYKDYGLDRKTRHLWAVAAVQQALFHILQKNLE